MSIKGINETLNHLNFMDNYPLQVFGKEMTRTRFLQTHIARTILGKLTTIED
jgi:hypothetical protein